MQIELKQVSYSYRLFGQRVNHRPAVNRISVAFNRCEIVGIVGPSGSGKSTMVQIINGLIQPDGGQVLVNGEPASYKGEAHRNWQLKVGLVFQFPENQFFEDTVFDEIAFALRLQNRPEKEIEQRVAESIARLNFRSTKILSRSPFQLSEGQKRRVAIASLLVLDPEILILDEPTAGLDYAGILVVKDLIRETFLKGHTVLLISHDMDLVAELSHRIIALQEGEVVFDGRKEDFFLNNRLLEKLQLEPPRVVSVAARLKNSGKIRRFPLFSLSELQQELKAACIDN